MSSSLLIIHFNLSDWQSQLIVNETSFCLFLWFSELWPTVKRNKWKVLKDNSEVTIARRTIFYGFLGIFSIVDVNHNLMAIAVVFLAIKINVGVSMCLAEERKTMV